MAYFGPHKKLFALDMICAFGMSGVDVAFPLFTQYLLRQLIPAMEADHSLMPKFLLLLGLAVLAYLIRAGLQYIVTYWGHRLGAHIETDMRRDIFAHIQTHPHRKAPLPGDQ